ncbi:hypothetical protein SBA4_1900020 [Candidatus Sulfopaludibacter sp. SbA4]|nr:hypothetical protein SBA4_1900020 [Candidatus Sulfopaludibacter sp. SbA4]
MEPGIWFDPDFLKDAEDHGNSITLDPKGHETANLRFLTTEK